MSGKQNFVDLRFRQSDETGAPDLDANAPVEVTLLDGLPVNVVMGGGSASMDFLPGQIALAGLVTPKRVVDVRPSRTRVVIKNTDATIAVTIGTATVTSTTGLPLLAGESVSLFTRADIWAISASGTPTLAWWEEFN